jgi:membrane protein YqaA with SNARE-associated domain
MGEIVGRARALALAWGMPGLFVVTFLDSSVLPLPGVADALVIVMAARHPHLVLLYAAGATLGSLGGCLVMYFLGRKGGEALVRQRFKTGNVERALESLRRHGVMAVLIVCLLPPPAPFKIFLLLAGAIGISAARFATAIAIGRGVRYLALGWLGARYGTAALSYVRRHGGRVSLVAAGLLAAAFGAYSWWNRARAPKPGLE